MIAPFLLYSALNFMNPTAKEGFVKLHIEVENQDTNFVSLNLPQDNFFDDRPTPGYQNLKGGKSFDYTIPLKKSSFMGIVINKEFYLMLAVCLNDSISIKAKRLIHSNYPDYEYAISGSNAVGHEIFMKNFNPAGKYLFYLEGFTKQYKNYTDYFIASKNYVDSLTSTWDSLQRKNLISEECSQLYTAEVRGTAYHTAIQRLGNVKTMDSGWNNYNKWRNLRDVMFYYAHASDPVLLRTNSGSNLYKAYLTSVLKNDDALTDSSLLRKSDMGYYFYYDSAYREDAWGHHFISLKNVFPDPSSFLQSELELFKKYYPHSLYVQQIKQFDDSVAIEKKPISSYLNINTGQFAKLKDIFAKTDGRFFFIDVWATWSGQSIQELRNFNATSRFLNKNNIKEVFWSLDKRRDSTQWINFIKEQSLSGDHYILSENNQEELIRLLPKTSQDESLFIPKYLLYDKVKDKYYTDLPRLGTREVLYSFLLNIIK